jgi:succinate dehydrogenase / fumarate reductase flavoprotein subunit
MMRQVNAGTVKLYPRTEMLDIVLIEGKARGIITRDLVSGKIERHFGHAVVIATGGYGRAFFLSTNAMGSNGSASWQAYKRGAFFANPSCADSSHPLVHGIISQST